MEEDSNMSADSVFTEEDLNKINALPTEHKSRIFTALEKHFDKYNDLLRNPPTQMGITSGPQKDDL